MVTDNSLKTKAYKIFKRNYQLALVILTLLSIIFITIGILMPQDSLPERVLFKLLLIEIGTTILVASTIGVFLTGAYKKLRDFTIENEIFDFVDRMQELINHPEEFKTFQLIAHMEKAGLIAFYSNRMGPAKDDLRARLNYLLKEDKSITILMIGDTLRVFFGPEGPFTSMTYEIISKKPNIHLKVLLLNRNSKLALYRSEAEKGNPPTTFKSFDEYKQALGYKDSENSSARIQTWNNELTKKRGNIPIDVKYYDCADHCLGILFPDLCYTAQYIYADSESQSSTPGIPMLKFSAESMMYQRLLWNFNWIWEHHSISYEELIQSVQRNPVIK